jgi:hypothetical protein
MLADADRIGKISRAYIEQGVLAAGSTVATAEERVIAELEKIKSVFEDVGPFMDKIEDFRDRLERRILFGASRFSSFSTQSGEEQTLD